MPKLYPPQINGTIPAFWLTYDSSNLVLRGAELKIPFAMNQTVSATDIKGFVLRLRTASSGSYLFSPIFSNDFNLSNNTVTFHLNPTQAGKLNEGQYYKVQIAYCTTTSLNSLNVEEIENVGYFSTVGIIKCTSKPSIYITNLNQDSINLFTNQYIGVYDLSDCRDKTEKVYSYNFSVYDSTGALFYTTGEQLHKTYYDTNQSISLDTVLLNDFMNNETSYSIQYTVTTINGLELTSPKYSLTANGIASPNKTIQILPTMDDEKGYTVIHFKGELNKAKSFYYILEESNFQNISMDYNLPIFMKDPELINSDTQKYRYYYNKDTRQKTPVDILQTEINKTEYKVQFLQSKSLYRQWRKRYDGQPYYFYTILDNEPLGMTLVSNKYYFNTNFLQTVLNKNIDDIYKRELADITSWPTILSDRWEYYNDVVYLEKIGSCLSFIKKISLTEVEENNIQTDQLQVLAFDEQEALYYGAYILSRASNDDNYSTWYNINRFRLDDQSPSSITINDITIEHGKKYKYALTQYNLWGLQSTKMISEEYQAGFEDAYLYDGEKTLRIRYNPEVSSFKITVLEQKSDTLGGKFPFITRNGDTFYREFPIAGLLAQELDIDNSFCNKNVPIGHRHSTSSTGENIEDELRDWRMFSDKNIALEREFKMNVLEWLNNGKPKLFKSPYEGNFIVRLLNNSLTPIKELGRMLHNFQSQAYEIAECTYENLVAYGFIKMGFPSDYVGLFRTYNFTDEECFNQNNDVEINFDASLVSFTIQDMMPGDIIYLKFYDSDDYEEIMIGITGSYTYTGDRTVKQVFIPQYQYEKIHRNIIGTINCYYYGARITAFDAIMSMQLKTIPSAQFIGVDPMIYSMRSMRFGGANQGNLTDKQIKFLSDFSIRDYLMKFMVFDENQQHYTVKEEDWNKFYKLLNSYDTNDLLERINISLNSGEINKLELMKLEYGKFRLRELIPVFEVNNEYNELGTRNTHWDTTQEIHYNINNNEKLIGEQKDAQQLVYVSLSPFGHPFPIEELAESTLIDPFCIFEIYRRVNGEWVPAESIVQVRDKQVIYTNFYDPYYKTFIPNYDPIIKINYNWKKVVFTLPEFGFDYDIKSQTLENINQDYVDFCMNRRLQLQYLSQGKTNVNAANVEDYELLKDNDNNNYYIIEGKWTGATFNEIITYTEITFNDDINYEANKYYYLDENNDYVLDTADVITDDRVYYVATSSIDQQPYDYNNQININLLDLYEPYGNTYLLTDDISVQPYKVYYIKQYDNEIDLASIREKDYTDLSDVNSIHIGNAVMAELTIQLKVLDFYTESSQPEVKVAKEKYLKEKEFFMNLLRSYSILEEADKLRIKNGTLKNLYDKLLHGTLINGQLTNDQQIYLTKLLQSDKEVTNLKLLSLYEVIYVDSRIGDELVNKVIETVKKSKANDEKQFQYENLQLFTFTDDTTTVYYVCDTSEAQYTEEGENLNWYYQIKNDEDFGIYFNIDKNNYYINNIDEENYLPFLNLNTNTVIVKTKDAIVNSGYTVYPLEKDVTNLVLTQLQLLNDDEYKELLKDDSILEIRKIIYKDGKVIYENDSTQTPIDSDITKTFFEYEAIEMLSQLNNEEEVKGTQNKQDIVNNTLEEFNKQLNDNNEKLEELKTNYLQHYNNIQKALERYNNKIYYRWALDEFIRLLQANPNINFANIIDYTNDNLSELTEEQSKYITSFDLLYRYYSAIMENKVNLKDLLSACLDNIAYRKEMILDNFRDEELDIELNKQINIDFGNAVTYLYLIYYLIKKMNECYINMVSEQNQVFNEKTITKAEEYIKKVYSIYNYYYNFIISSEENVQAAKNGLEIVVQQKYNELILFDQIFQNSLLNLNANNKTEWTDNLTYIQNVSKSYDDFKFIDQRYDTSNNIIIRFEHDNIIKDFQIFNLRNIVFIDLNNFDMTNILFTGLTIEQQYLTQPEPATRIEQMRYRFAVILNLLLGKRKALNKFNNEIQENLFYYRHLLESIGGSALPSSEEEENEENLYTTFIFYPLNPMVADPLIATKFKELSLEDFEYLYLNKLPYYQFENGIYEEYTFNYNGQTRPITKNMLNNNIYVYINDFEQYEKITENNYLDFTGDKIYYQVMPQYNENNQYYGHYLSNKDYYNHLTKDEEKQDILQISAFLNNQLLEIINTYSIRDNKNLTIFIQELIQDKNIYKENHYISINSLDDENSLLIEVKETIQDFNNYIQKVMTEYGIDFFGNELSNYVNILNSMLYPNIISNSFLSREYFLIPTALFEGSQLRQDETKWQQLLQTIMKEIGTSIFTKKSIISDLSDIDTIYNEMEEIAAEIEIQKKKEQTDEIATQISQLQQQYDDKEDNLNLKISVLKNQISYSNKIMEIWNIPNTLSELNNSNLKYLEAEWNVLNNNTNEEEEDEEQEEKHIITTRDLYTKNDFHQEEQKNILQNTIKKVVEQYLDNLRYEYLIDDDHRWTIIENFDITHNSQSLLEGDLDIDNIQNIYTIILNVIINNIDRIYYMPKTQELILDLTEKDITTVINNTLSEEGAFSEKIIKTFQEQFIDVILKLIEQAEQLLLLYEQQATDYTEKYDTYNKIYVENNTLFNTFKTQYPEIYEYYIQAHADGATQDGTMFTLEAVVDNQRNKVKDAWKDFINILDKKYTEEKKSGLYI